MVYWLSTLLVILSGVTAGTLLWGVRRHAIVKRLHIGITALLQHRTPPVMQRSPEDAEQVLAAFDQLASQVAEERQSDALTERSRDVEAVLERLVSMLQQPLVAVQTYASLIKQAPDIPPNGDTHDLVQRLHHQINGLVRLFEASPNANELRAAISGLERDLVLPPTDVRPTRTLLVVDDENLWTLHLADLCRRLKLQVLIAPGADAAAIMAKAVQPRAILVHVGRNDGLGWRALVPLRRERRLASVPVILYRAPTDSSPGWVSDARDVWFWPLPNNDDSRIVRQALRGNGRQYHLWGDAELALEVGRWLGIAGIAAEYKSGTTAAPTGCCQLVIEHIPSTNGRETILIIPVRMIPADVSTLERGIQSLVDLAPLASNELEQTLVQRLGWVAESPSVEINSESAARKETA